MVEEVEEITSPPKKEKKARKGKLLATSRDTAVSCVRLVPSLICRSRDLGSAISLSSDLFNNTTIRLHECRDGIYVD